MPTHDETTAEQPAPPVRPLYAKEVAFQLRKSVKTLSRWRGAGIGPTWSYSIPGNARSAVRYDPESVAMFAAIERNDLQLALDLQPAESAPAT